MKQLDKNDPNGARLDIRGYLYLFWAWAWLIVLAGALAGATAFLVSKRMTPMYEASARLLVNAPSTISGVDPSTGMLTMQTLTSTYAQMLMDPSVLEGVIEKLKLQRTPEELTGSISVKTITDTQLLEITAQDADPQRAADIADAMATVFAARIQGLRSQRYAAVRDGLSAQLSNMEQSISTTTNQIEAVEQEMAAAEAQKASIAGTQFAVAATQTVMAIKPQGAVAETQTVTAMQQQIVVAATQTAVAAPATVIPAALLQLQDRMTQYRTVYSNLVLSYEQVRMAEEQAGSNVVVSEQARVNTVPVRPKTWQNTLLAALAGMMLAAGAVFAAETLDDTIRDPEEVQREFGLPILGIIVRHEVSKGQLVALAEPRSLMAEAFRSLRTNITHAAVSRLLRRILITSPTPQEGKTTVACNLSVVLSQNEKRVILVDADLRSPQVHHELGLQNRVGLSELFVRPLDDVSSVVHAINPPKLAVLTSGGLPPNPAELITSHLMGQILDTLNRDFDMIVIDAPPLLIVTDAAALVPLVDGVVLVAKPGTTKAADLKQALRQLRTVGAPVLGLVLSEVNPSNRRYGYYYSRYFSRYSDYYSTRPNLGRVLTSGARRKTRSGATPPEPEAVVAEVEAVAAERKAVATEPGAIVAGPQLTALSPSPTIKRGGQGKNHSKAAVEGVRNRRL